MFQKANCQDIFQRNRKISDFEFIHDLTTEYE